MIGTLILWIGFGAALVSAWSHFQGVTKTRNVAKLAQRSFHATVFAVIVASFLLLLFILQHRFEYSYVWSYSSKNLPLYLLVTTFWAGQEGSFLFWALCSVVIGVFLLNYTRRRNIESEVMSVYLLIQSFLLLLLITKSPFQYIWDGFPGQVTVGSAPTDGRGLNPLLQNFWMIVHPPVLFVGFAAMAVPFTFAVVALWQRTFGKWIKYALPWVLFGVLALGAGLMLGGYWAYGVLGWGGWWGWDPVENSSLIPWITGVALLHTMIVQKRTGNLVRTNFVLAVVTFLLVIYSTFLTRSGVLGSASVHSFTDPGAIAYTLLILWMGTMGVLGLGLIARRWKEMKELRQQIGLVTRESFIAVGCAIMAVSALMIFIGTSWPIVANASVEPAFYDKVNLPIAILMAVLLGLSLKLRWRQESSVGLLRQSLFALIASALPVGILLLLGIFEWTMLLLVFSAFFVFFINADRLYRVARENPKLLGGPLAHIGFALLLLGIIGSGRYGEKQTIALPLNDPQEVFGHRLTYLGSEPTTDGKWKFVVNVERENGAFKLEPVMFQSSYNNSIMRNPDYASFLTKDFYIEPVSLEAGDGRSHPHDVFELKKGEPQTIGEMKVTFARFNMSHDGKESMTAGGGFPVGAVLVVERNGEKQEITPVTVYREGQEPETKTVMLDEKIGFKLLSINVNAGTKLSQIQINVVGLHEELAGERKSEMLVIEASLKPFISLIWLATILVLAGFFISMKYRRQEDAIEESLQTGKKTGRDNGSSLRYRQKKEPFVETLIEER